MRGLFGVIEPIISKREIKESDNVLFEYKEYYVRDRIELEDKLIKMGINPHKIELIFMGNYIENINIPEIDNTEKIQCTRYSVVYNQ